MGRETSPQEETSLCYPCRWGIQVLYEGNARRLVSHGHPMPLLQAPCYRALSARFESGRAMIYCVVQYVMGESVLLFETESLKLAREIARDYQLNSDKGIFILRRQW